MSESEPRLSRIDTSRAVTARALDWPANYEDAWHYHNRGQLLFASSGIMNLTTGEGIWVIPPQRAVWIPAEAQHKIVTSTAVAFRSVYVDPAAFAGLPEKCFVLGVSPLLRALILEAMEVEPLYEPGGREDRIMALIVDELSAASAAPGNFYLQQPRDQRVQPIVTAILGNPADERTRDDWSTIVGASSRTIDRIFQSETGMSFKQWKRQALLLESLRLLADGQPVTNVAIDLGYDSPSAFIAMFRRALGVTPGRQFK